MSERSEGRKVAIVTGPNGGIRSAISPKLGTHGYKIVLNYHTLEDKVI